MTILVALSFYVNIAVSSPFAIQSFRSEWILFKCEWSVLGFWLRLDTTKRCNAKKFIFLSTLYDWNLLWGELKIRRIKKHMCVYWMLCFYCTINEDLLHFGIRKQVYLGTIFWNMEILCKFEEQSKHVFTWYSKTCRIFLMK